MSCRHAWATGGEMNGVLIVGIGGFIGSVARYLVALALPLSATGFPYATLLVNLAGSFLIGLISELSISTTLLTPQARLFLATGVCGGFTTFSSAMYETMSLTKEGHLLSAGMYVAGSAIGGMLTLYAGMASAKLWS